MTSDRLKIAKELHAKIKETEVSFVDFRFTDSNGAWHQISFDVSHVDEDTLVHGLMFDGSSIPGWKSIDNSDMCLKPEMTRAGFDQINGDSFIVICNVYDPVTGERYGRDPRSTALRAEQYMQAAGFADVAYFGPEPEFFIFDKAEFSTSPHASFFKVQGREIPGSENILSHRSQHAGGYAPCAPSDPEYELRAQMCHALKAMGVDVEKHHHEVAANQHELGVKYDTLTCTADVLQLFKYVVKNVAENAGKTATFMPKPVLGDNGSGMHVHQSLWKAGQNVFKGAQYGGLSETALYYIGGILRHARAINAFTNPTTNSYKRLVPGYEAPVYRAYSARNRSVAVRIPYVTSANARRIEVRFPDPSANPYLALAAMLMAGLDGIENKICPGDACDINLFDPALNPLGSADTLASSLEEALEALHDDHAFLLKGDVFSQDQIESYIQLKKSDSERLNTTPQPVEYEMYYRC